MFLSWDVLRYRKVYTVNFQLCFSIVPKCHQLILLDSNPAVVCSPDHSRSQSRARIMPRLGDENPAIISHFPPHPPSFLSPILRSSHIFINKLKQRRHSSSTSKRRKMQIKASYSMSMTLVLLLCFMCSTGKTFSAFLVGAFLPSMHIDNTRSKLASSPSLVVVGGTIGNDDFAKIFGKQEAAERRTRDLAYEFRHLPKERNAVPDEAIHKNKTREDGIVDKEKRNSIHTAGSLNLDINRTKSVTPSKYVPPPHL
jgi:hypothetical protein